jgi:hypothetical protein
LRSFILYFRPTSRVLSGQTALLHILSATFVQPSVIEPALFPLCRRPWSGLRFATGTALQCSHCLGTALIQLSDGHVGRRAECIGLHSVVGVSLSLLSVASLNPLVSCNHGQCHIQPEIATPHQSPHLQLIALSITNNFKGFLSYLRTCCHPGTTPAPPLVRPSPCDGSLTSISLTVAARAPCALFYNDSCHLRCCSQILFEMACQRSAYCTYRASQGCFGGQVSHIASCY